MIINDIWYNSNMNYDTHVEIWDFEQENLLFDETAEQLTEKMMHLRIYKFEVINTDNRGINEIHFTLRRGEKV